MATVERQIDALGGTHSDDGEYNAGYADGYSQALDAAVEIGREADDLIEELLECIDDALRGFGGLEQWATTARVLHTRVTNRRAA